MTYVDESTNVTVGLGRDFEGEKALRNVTFYSNMSMRPGSFPTPPLKFNERRPKNVTLKTTAIFYLPEEKVQKKTEEKISINLRMFLKEKRTQRYI